MANGDFGLRASEFLRVLALGLEFGFLVNRCRLPLGAIPAPTSFFKNILILMLA
jgi:hypothetical protein